ncbi:folate-binding protein [Rhodopseudomonas sp. HC1]|uniref:CAF17-like 4Fe-4S cluster assembly/insertion protein YgfZ n=1 Tax=Rhodopseudomonas infernalis TaxID=2897386 RepID=UPI001EE96449|nr:folate-binding protein [Rhodopseudomonas infernalis]MCG6205509.1 folate-binding protein [Rhodopseudomonas infernalis]
MKATFLPDRGVIKISGPDARHLLNGLVTTDLTKLVPGQGRFGALLTPQGKIVADFFITEMAAEDDGGFLLDCPKALAEPLATKLKFYKLRAKALIENLSDRLGVLALWDGAPAQPPEMGFADPRADQLGWRIIVPELLAPATAEALGATVVATEQYDAHRIACGVPTGGIDFGYADAFPHEANMDRLHGVDFTKGCYIGQEVVSRMHHRGTARTRIVRVTFEGAAPQPGSDIMAGEKSVGIMGSSAEGRGLALLRIDRVAEARAAGLPLGAPGVALTIADPDDLIPTQRRTGT